MIRAAGRFRPAVVAAVLGLAVMALAPLALRPGPPEPEIIDVTYPHAFAWSVGPAPDRDTPDRRDPAWANRLLGLASPSTPRLPSALTPAAPQLQPVISTQARVVPSALTRSGIPDAALRAYVQAGRTMRVSDPSCHLPWTLLAAIGRVESNHGRFAGGVLGRDGRPVPAIIGMRLDGSGATARILDTDGGHLDGDAEFDRAIGPMQFLPGTWRAVAADGDRDGSADPHDIDDAALGAAVYLCAYDADLGEPDALRHAVWRYNHSDAYVDLVLALMKLYAGEIRVLPTPVTPVVPVPVNPKLPPGPASPSLPSATPSPSVGPPSTNPTPPVAPTHPGSPDPSTPTPGPTPTSDPTPTSTPEPTPTATPEPTATPGAPTPTASPTPSCPNPTATPTPTDSATPTPTPTPTGTGTGTPDPSATPTSTPTGSATPIPSSTPTPSDPPTC